MTNDKPQIRNNNNNIILMVNLEKVLLQILEISRGKYKNMIIVRGLVRNIEDLIAGEFIMERSGGLLFSKVYR